MLHASETWPVTKPCLQRLQRNDRAMIRQICNVKPQDTVTIRSTELLARLTAVCSARVCRAQCSMPVKLGRVYSMCVRSAILHASETWPVTKPCLQRLQRNDRAMIRQICNVNHKTLPPSGPLNYLHGLELKTWTSY